MATKGLDLTALTAEVERNDSVDGSAKTLIEQLAAAFEAVKGDPVAVQALVDRLRAANDALSAAVSADPRARNMWPWRRRGDLDQQRDPHGYGIGTVLARLPDDEVAVFIEPVTLTFLCEKHADWLMAFQFECFHASLKD